MKGRWRYRASAWATRAMLVVITIVSCFPSILAMEADAKNLQKPNILFIMADDHGWNDVDWHDPTLDTPYLNQLAHSDNTVQLENAYVNQCCSPSVFRVVIFEMIFEIIHWTVFRTRSAFMSGYYPYRLGTQVNEWIGRNICKIVEENDRRNCNCIFCRPDCLKFLNLLESRLNISFFLNDSALSAIIRTWLANGILATVSMIFSPRKEDSNSFLDITVDPKTITVIKQVSWSHLQLLALTTRSFPLQSNTPIILAWKGPIFSATLKTRFQINGASSTNILQ